MPTPHRHPCTPRRFEQPCVSAHAQHGCHIHLGTGFGGACARAAPGGCPSAWRRARLARLYPSPALSWPHTAPPSSARLLADARLHGAALAPARVVGHVVAGEQKVLARPRGAPPRARSPLLALRGVSLPCDARSAQRHGAALDHSHLTIALVAPRPCIHPSDNAATRVAAANLLGGSQGWQASLGRLAPGAKSAGSPEAQPCVPHLALRCARRCCSARGASSRARRCGACGGGCAVRRGGRRAGRAAGPRAARARARPRARHGLGLRLRVRRARLGGRRRVAVGGRGRRGRRRLRCACGCRVGRSRVWRVCSGATTGDLHASRNL